MLRTTIPFIDLRGKTLTDLLRSYPDKASALLSASRRTFGLASWLASWLLLPFFDKKSHRWLRRSNNPYLREIEAAADFLGKKGVYTLNLSYEWGCTSGAYLVAGQVHMLRVLDWPLAGLGKHIMVALQRAGAGDYYNITWPGLSGVYQGMAPGRFAAAINLAPMRKHGLGLAGDWLRNRFILDRQKALPPSHLLRLVFEQAGNYHEAKEMLCKTPVAAPVIFTLTGLIPGEGCIIERLENAAEIKELLVAQLVSASNEFHSPLAARGRGWRPRVIDSAGRYRQSLNISAHDMQQGDFGWLRPPMLNRYTRLVMQAEAATGMLMVQGYEGQGAVTECYKLAASGQ
ncbi:MAG: hypothetical protein SFX19_00765 [Alphaproteobacteria bacterium]|nr:hypothetical protein [Alphaproteobacteria bacterium]